MRHKKAEAMLGGRPLLPQWADNRMQRQQ